MKFLSNIKILTSIFFAAGMSLLCQAASADTTITIQNNLSSLSLLNGSCQRYDGQTCFFSYVPYGGTRIPVPSYNIYQLGTGFVTLPPTQAVENGFFTARIEYEFDSQFQCRLLIDSAVGEMLPESFILRASILSNQASAPDACSKYVVDVNAASKTVTVRYPG